MCGILAYYKAGGFSLEDLHKGLGALRSMDHRGPDGEGIVLIDSRTGQNWSYRTSETPKDINCDLDDSTYLHQQADLMLGHRRLSIFDLSSRGHQPMRDRMRGKGNVLCLNGEVYNFLELRTELKAKGHVFGTETDTEVILAAYREWGPEALARFNGMWTIFLWDRRAQQLLVSSDRIGIKQLYTWGNSEEFLLSSEIKAIRALKKTGFSLHSSNAQFFLENGQMDFNQETLFKEVRRFPPSHFKLAAPRDLMATDARRFWDFPKAGRKHRSLKAAAEELRALLDSAIDLRMRSDVPWGTTLSGGLDSSAIVYAAQGIRKQRGEESPIHTFTAIFPGEQGDESKFVRLIEKDLGLDAKYTNPLDTFDFEDFERFLRHQDLPVVTTSPYAQWSVMKMVGDSDVTVLLDGQGGDELFAGYHHHLYKMGRDLLLRGKLLACRRLVRQYCELKGMDPKVVMKYIRDDVKLYLKLKAGRKLPGPPEATTWNKARKLSDVLHLDITSWVMPMLLRYEDRNSMAFAIEARLPFLDYRIVEFAMTLPDKFKIHKGWQKYILREAMPELPAEIRYRKDKKGFTTPHDEWMKRFRKRFMEMAAVAAEADVELPRGAKTLEELNSQFLFRMASLGAWLKG